MYVMVLPENKLWMSYGLGSCNAQKVNSFVVSWRFVGFMRLLREKVK